MTDRLEDWIGRTERLDDVAAAAPIAGLAAVLDHVDPPWRQGEVPPLGHWLYFLPFARQSELGEDGHPRRGGFLPPVTLPRRMWAGGRFDFHSPIPVGAPISRLSTIADVKSKTGGSGEMVFVTVRHDISVEGQLAITEEHDIVYRGAGAAMVDPGPPPPADPEAPGRVVAPDITMLFRYSALTFNAHRIHYDRDYVVGVEGYLGIIVHGPLTATLLIDAWQRLNPGAAVARYAFRAKSPLFDGAPIRLVVEPRAGGANLSAVDPYGRVAMEAQLEAR